MATETTPVFSLPVSVLDRLRTQFSVPTSEHGSRWSALWDDSFIPWDQGISSPALQDLLSQHTAFLGLTAPTGKRTLVPGCGRGYDVQLFASYGLAAFGVEIAETAVVQARELAEQQQQQQQLAGTTRFEAGDFYSREWVRKMLGDEEATFDYVYDYTFLCAMPLELRPAWGKRMAELVTPGTGFLVCLEFPLYKPLELGGPPWGLTSAVYEELLGGKFEKVLHYKAERTHDIGRGTEYIAVWQRKEEGGENKEG